jgi:hypothetical protein
MEEVVSAFEAVECARQPRAARAMRAEPLRAETPLGEPFEAL